MSFGDVMRLAAQRLEHRSSELSEAEQWADVARVLDAVDRRARGLPYDDAAARRLDDLLTDSSAPGGMAAPEKGAD